MRPQAQDISNLKPPVTVIEWVGDAREGHLRLLDQTKLPARTAFMDCNDIQAVFDAIRRLVVRGAPAIGIAAGYGMVLAAQSLEDVGDEGDCSAGLKAAAEYLIGSRPTAVNLEWAARRVLQCGQGACKSSTVGLCEVMLGEARAIGAEDEALCLAIGRAAGPLIEKANGVLTHCNAGALATGGIGTATAGMYAAHAAGHEFTVYCSETRPLLQGSRLTAWELMQASIDATIITDSTAGQVMREGRVEMVITGADRIAANGDVANKIGTYGLAVLAGRHEIPFYVAGPYSTFDLGLPNGEAIPIEQRGGEEIVEGFGRRTAPAGAKVYSPAFDVTPADLVMGIITDCGIIQPVNEDNVRKVIAG